MAEGALPLELQRGKGPLHGLLIRGPVVQRGDAIYRPHLPTGLFPIVPQ